MCQQYRRTPDIWFILNCCTISISMYMRIWMQSCFSLKMRDMNPLQKYQTNQSSQLSEWGLETRTLRSPWITSYHPKTDQENALKELRQCAPKVIAIGLSMPCLVLTDPFSSKVKIGSVCPRVPLDKHSTRLKCLYVIYRDVECLTTKSE